MKTKNKDLIRLTVKRKTFLIFLAVLCILLIIRFLADYMLSDSKKSGNEKVFDHKKIIGTYTVEHQPVTLVISLSGTIQPIKKINIASPFDSNVIEKNFSYGQKVKKGDILLILDTTKIKTLLRQAKSDYIKARQSVETLKSWDKSNEVSSARRLYTKAKNDIDIYNRKLDDAKILFEKGIISESEYDSAKQLFDNQQLAYKTAEEELNAVLEKGSKDNREMAAMSLKNAEIRVKELEDQLEKSTIKSPEDGVALMLMENGTLRRTIEKGSAVLMGEIIFSLGNLEGLSVNTKIDEVDIGKIKIGQKAFVSGDAFKDIILTGKIDYISSQAARDPLKGFAVFDVKVVIDSLTDIQKEKVKPGMSAYIDVEVYKNPKALMVPVNMLKEKDGKSFVYVKDKEKVKECFVKTGITTFDSVEILEGLKAKDTILQP